MNIRGRRHHSQRPGLLRVAATITMLGAAACRSSSTDDITATGTLEIVQVDVAPLSAGRVVRVLVREGDFVHAGDTVAVLTQPSARADVAGRASSVAASRANLQGVERGPRAPELARARAELSAAEADATRAAADLVRLRPLAEKQIVSRRQLDAAVAVAKTAADRRDAARAALRLLQEGSTREAIAAARAQVGTAQAALSATQAVVGDLILIAPVNGVVMDRDAEPGDVLPPAAPAVTIGDVTRPWVRVYVNERALPFIHVGDPARGVLDGVPGHVFVGRVAAINPQAEYTPRVALTEAERADLMFGVKVEFTDPSGMLKAGLPITVTFQRRTAGGR